MNEENLGWFMSPLLKCSQLQMLWSIPEVSATIIHGKNFEYLNDTSGE